MARSAFSLRACSRLGRQVAFFAVALIVGAFWSGAGSWSGGGSSASRRGPHFVADMGQAQLSHAHDSAAPPSASLDSLLDEWADGEVAVSSSGPPAPTAAGSVDSYVESYLTSERRARRRARGLRRLLHTVSRRELTGASPSLDSAATLLAAGEGSFIANGGPHEDDLWLPEPTSLERCITQMDGSELCEYGNVCVDIITGGGEVSTDGKLLFVASNVLPPPEEAPKSAHGNRPRTGPPSLGVASDATDAARRARHAARLTYSHGKHDLREFLHGGAVDEVEDAQYDSVYEDVPGNAERTFLEGLRRIPFSFGARSLQITPESTVPAHLGGTFNGTVAWVEDMYVGRLSLGGQMWGCGAALPMPLFGAWYANTTQHLDLPPLHHMISLFKDHVRIWNDTDPDPLGQYAGRWCLDGALQVAGHMTPGRTPGWVGRNKEGPQRGAAFAHLDALAALLPAGSKNPGATSYPLRVPYSFLTMENTAPGARFIFTTGDVPHYPAPFAVPVGEATKGGGGAQAQSPRHNYRMCGKRVIGLGNRAVLLGGQAEGSAWREFAVSQLRLPREPPFSYPMSDTLPPPRVLFFTRTKQRDFYNLPELIAIAEKYGVPYDVLGEKQLVGLSFAQQANLVRHYGIAVAIHGAGETLFGFLTKRSVVIEVSPFQMWCPIYHKYLTTIGHTVLPIYSRLKSPNVNWEFMTADPRPTSTDAFWKKCELESLIFATRSSCWAESKSMQEIYVPVHEFEHAFTRALDLIGQKVFPQFSPIDMLHGLAQGGPDTKFAPAGYYKNASWVLCPPSTTCPTGAAAAAAAVNKPYQLMVNSAGENPLIAQLAKLRKK